MCIYAKVYMGGREEGGGRQYVYILVGKIYVEQIITVLSNSIKYKIQKTFDCL